MAFKLLPQVLSIDFSIVISLELGLFLSLGFIRLISGIVDVLVISSYASQLQKFYSKAFHLHVI